MYYYLVEPQRARGGEAFLEKLANLTTDLGIAGEIVIPSQAKPIEQLIDIGLTKGYTTLVYVGSDRFLMQAISPLMERPVNNRPVIGLIPRFPDSPINHLLGFTSFRQALQQLKLRKLAYATLAEIGPKKYLLTETTLSVAKPIRCQITVDDATLEVEATDIILTGKNQLIIHNRRRRPHPILRFGAWLVGGEILDRSTSLFHGSQIRITTPEPLPFLSEGEILARTPIASRIVRRALKIIVGRANLDQGSNKRQSATRAEE